MAIPQPSLVIAPADIGAHWDLDLPESAERLQLGSTRNVVARAGVSEVIAPVAGSVDRGDATCARAPVFDWEYARLDWPAAEVSALVWNPAAVDAQLRTLERLA